MREGETIGVALRLTHITRGTEMSDTQASHIVEKMTPRILPITLAVMSAVCLATAPAARADMITYEFSVSPQASFNGAAGTYDLLGTFTWDTTTNTVDSANVSLSGPLGAGTYTEQASLNGAPAANNFISIENTTNTDVLVVSFASSLSLGATDNIVPRGFDPFVCVNLDNNCNTEDIGSSASGDASPVPAPLIGHGFPVVLAVGGLLFGAKLWERSKSRRSFGTAIPRATA
jgi:hypothetical protein